MDQQDSPKLDIRKFKRHQRKYPWSLIIKILMASIIIGLLVYLNKILDDKKPEDRKEIEVEIDSSIAPEVSPDL